MHCWGHCWCYVSTFRSYITTVFLPRRCSQTGGGRFSISEGVAVGLERVDAIILWYSMDHDVALWPFSCQMTQPFLARWRDLPCQMTWPFFDIPWMMTRPFFILWHGLYLLTSLVWLYYNVNLYKEGKAKGTTQALALRLATSSTLGVFPLVHELSARAHSHLGHFSFSRRNYPRYSRHHHH